MAEKDWSCTRQGIQRKTWLPQDREQPASPTTDIENVDLAARYVRQQTAKHPAVEPFLDANNDVLGASLFERIVVGGIDQIEPIGEHRHDKENIARLTMKKSELVRRGEVLNVGRGSVKSGLATAQRTAMRHHAT